MARAVEEDIVRPGALRASRPFPLWGPLSALGLSLAVLACGIDQAHKWWMIEVLDISARQPFSVAPILDLVLNWNRGISYGWFAHDSRRAQWLLITLSLGVSLWLWSWLARTPRPLTAAALGLIIGGAVANALDRLRFSAVADFFMFHWQDWNWYVFNLADVAIVAGVALLLYESIGAGRSGA